MLRRRSATVALKDAQKVPTAVLKTIGKLWKQKQMAALELELRRRKVKDGQIPCPLVSRCSPGGGVALIVKAAARSWRSVKTQQIASGWMLEKATAFSCEGQPI